MHAISNKVLTYYCCIITLREEYVYPYICSGMREVACPVGVVVEGVVVGLMHLQIGVDIAVLTAQSKF